LNRVKEFASFTLCSHWRNARGGGRDTHTQLPVRNAQSTHTEREREGARSTRALTHTWPLEQLPVGARERVVRVLGALEVGEPVLEPVGLEHGEVVGGEGVAGEDALVARGGQDNVVDGVAGGGCNACNG
jgi:hypothetical protein